MYNFKNTSLLTLSLFPFTVSHVWIVWACDSLCMCWYLYHRVIWTEGTVRPGPWTQDGSIRLQSQAPSAAGISCGFHPDCCNTEITQTRHGVEIPRPA